MKLSTYIASAVAAAGFAFAGAANAAPIKTDIVFMIDATGSMSGEINGVRNGFSSFVSGLNSAAVDARFAVVVFGGQAELTLDFTSDTTVAQNSLNAITIGASSGVQNNHNVNPEAGLEVIRQVLGAAPISTLANNNIPQDGILNFRSDARKNLILVTDEDADAAFHVANRIAGESGEPAAGAAEQAEVNATATAVIQNNAYLNMLINIGDAPSAFQYGDYTKDVSDANLLNFDPTATLNNLLADAVTDTSLQAQVLNAGLIARTFNVNGANNANFVNNFFNAKLEEIVNDPGTPNDIPLPGAVFFLLTGLAGIAAAKRRA